MGGSQRGSDIQRADARRKEPEEKGSDFGEEWLRGKFADGCHCPRVPFKLLTQGQPWLESASLCCRRPADGWKAALSVCGPTECSFCGRGPSGRPCTLSLPTYRCGVVPDTPLNSNSSDTQKIVSHLVGAPWWAPRGLCDVSP